MRDYAKSLMFVAFATVPRGHDGSCVVKNYSLSEKHNLDSSCILYCYNFYMELIAVRHVVTPLNEERRINGVVDEEISETGRKQIPGLITQLGMYAFDVIYSSPLKRARETAEPIATHYNVPLRKDERITEINFGSFAGKSWESTVPYFGVNSSGVINTFAYDLRPFGGEFAPETKARVQSFLDDIRKRPESPLVVCHGGILRWIYYLCTCEPAIKIPNASVHRFML